MENASHAIYIVWWVLNPVLVHPSVCGWHLGRRTKKVGDNVKRSFAVALLHNAIRGIAPERASTSRSLAVTAKRNPISGSSRSANQGGCSTDRVSREWLVGSPVRQSSEQEEHGPGHVNFKVNRGSLKWKLHLKQNRKKGLWRCCCCCFCR